MPRIVVPQAGSVSASVPPSFSLHGDSLPEPEVWAEMEEGFGRVMLGRSVNAGELDRESEHDRDS